MNHMDCRTVRTDCALREQLLEMAGGPTPQRAPDEQAALPNGQAIASGCACCAVLALHFLACQCGRPLELLRDCRALFDRHLGS